MPHLSVSLALARTASMPVGTEASHAKTHRKSGSANLAAPGTLAAEPERELLQRLPSLPDLCDDSSDDSSSDDSNEEDHPSAARTCCGGDSRSSGMQLPPADGDDSRSKSACRAAAWAAGWWRIFPRHSAATGGLDGL